MNAHERGVEWFQMAVDGLRKGYLVAKLGRISSPPLRVNDSVDDPRALTRLLEVFRCGTATRAYADFVAFKRMQGQDPAPEWEAYVRTVCLAAGVDRLDPLELLPLPAATALAAPADRVTYHQAVMNDRPYVVASVGRVHGS